MLRIVRAAGLWVAVVAAGAPAQGQRGVEVVAKRADSGAISAPIAGRTVDLGKYHALLIGINDYQHPEFAPKLRTPMKDVETVRDLLIRQYGFDAGNVRVLAEAQATRGGILSALARYRDLPLSPNDNLLVYFAGHGYQHASTQDGFWIPVDGSSDESSWLPVSEIRRIVRNIRAKHTLLVSDSCFSGTLTRTVLTLPTEERYLGEVAAKDSYQVITSGGLEPVADGGRDGLSLFAYSLTTYLRDQSRPYVTATQLYSDLAPLVANASGARQTPEHGKIPDTFDQNGEFVFARVDRVDNTPPTARPVASVASAPSRPESTTPLPSGDVSPGATAFEDLSFRPPPGWYLNPNQPDEGIEYSHPQFPASLTLAYSTESDLPFAAATAAADRTRAVRPFCENIVARVQDQLSASLLTSSYTPIADDIGAFTCELSVAINSALAYQRVDLLDVPETERIYSVVTLSSSSPDARRASTAAAQAVLSSMRRRPN